MLASINGLTTRIDTVQSDIRKLREVDVAEQAFLYYEHELEQIERELRDLAIDMYQLYRESLLESGEYDSEQILVEVAKYSNICESLTMDELNISISKMLEEHPDIHMYGINCMYERMRKLEDSFRMVQQNYNNAYSRYQALLGEYQSTIDKYQYRSSSYYIH